MSRFLTKTLSAFLAVIITACAAFIVSAAEDEINLNPLSYPKFADKSYGALYAHATLGGDSAQAWQRWDNGYSGINSEQGVRYFFLPNTADDSRVEIYNNYEEDAVVGDTIIPSYTSAVVNYNPGEIINITVSTRNYKLKVYKSDSEASVYVNDTTNSYVDADGVTQNTDLYSFLIQNKENSVKGSDCAIAGTNTVTDTKLKKIKGRGNTNWRDTDKKPFNLQFNDTTTIGHTTNKKFSFVSNAKDSTLLRNSIMYDLADSVGSPYSPSQSFVDFFVNGVYRGCYIACQKIELGKNAVVSLKDDSDKQLSDFNFLVEVDVWNYAGDTYFVTDKGYHVVLKTPDLENYDDNNDTMNAKYTYIKNKYQEFENALYNGNLSELEKICDLNSLATQYLLQDFGKNCDGGYTSTFFTYNASEGKFYAAPIWDCDSDLGAVDCVRPGCSKSTCYYKDWVTRYATYTYNKKIKTVNPLGQAFNLSGTTSQGLNFEKLCAKIWQEKFIPEIDILLGKAPANGRLKSIDEYASSINQAGYNNYVMWNFMWVCSRYNSGLNETYPETYEGEFKYLKDWTNARAKWITSQLNTSQPDNPDNPTEPATDTTEIYFLNTLNWDNVNYYVWTDKNYKKKWPGESAEYVGKNVDGISVYKAVFDSSYKNIIFNDSQSIAQTDDIAVAENKALYSPADVKSTVSSKVIYSINSSDYKDSPVVGDTNSDGTVNINDAAAVQRHLAKITELSDSQLLSADTNGDNIVDILDATYIQKYCAKYFDEFPKTQNQ